MQETYYYIVHLYFRKYSILLHMSIILCNFGICAKHVYVLLPRNTSYRTPQNSSHALSSFVKTEAKHSHKWQTTTHIPHPTTCHRYKTSAGGRIRNLTLILLLNRYVKLGPGCKSGMHVITILNKIK